MSRLVILGLTALSLLAASIPASAGTCTTSCYGNTCTTHCY